MSNCPAKPENREIVPVVNMICDSVAQSVEQLPFKPWVRGSSPRWVTKNPECDSVRDFYLLSKPKRTPGYARGKKELKARGRVEKEKTPC